MIPEPTSGDNTRPLDPLDEWYRAAIAETLRPCRELPREERATQAALAAIRDEQVA